MSTAAVMDCLPVGTDLALDLAVKTKPVALCLWHLGTRPAGKEHSVPRMYNKLKHKISLMYP